MWRRPVVTILMLIIALILPLPMRAQQKIVAPTFRSACADLKVSATTAISSPAKPFTEEHISSMVRDGFGDESGAKLIEQRGIDFAPAEDFLQTLKAAGASEAFLKALRAANPPEPASAKKPLNQVQVFALLVGQMPSHRVTMLVQERGIDFDPTDDYLQEVRLAGGEGELVSALKSAKVTKPATVDPAAQARQAQVLQHVARGAELEQKKPFDDELTVNSQDELAVATSPICPVTHHPQFSTTPALGAPPLLSQGGESFSQPQAPFEWANAITRRRGRACPTRRSAW